MDIVYDIFEPCRVEEELVTHLREKKVYTEDEQKWTVELSPLSGRGIFARRDIQQGELIYVDAPLLIGPRCIAKHLPMCVTCYKNECPLFPCDHGCGLPICSVECENSQQHIDYECKYLRSLRPTCGSDWSNALLLCVTVIRALFMTEQERRCLATFQFHQTFSRSCEVDLLRRNVANDVPEKDVKFLERVCGLFNTNSFETVSVRDKDHTASLRALYPMGALQNHCCAPNTRHHFDKENRLYVIAASPIRAGEEITMPYTSLFWDTTLRRQFLFVSKHFWCKCKRCSDPTEFGSKLGALFCASDKCTGNLLPENSLDPKSPWICDECQLNVSNRQITSIRAGVASMVSNARYRHPRQIARFTQEELENIVPKSNHILVDMKFRIVSYLGRSEELSWKDLTDSELTLKRLYCIDLLSILDTLRCGDCQKKGLILYELYCTNVELMKRFHKIQNDCNRNSSDLVEIDFDENKKLLEKATSILQNDILATTLRESDKLILY